METIRTVRSRLAESPLGNKISQAQGQAKRGLRKVVTGNPDKKVRDYMKEVPQVKLVDKLSFTWGVTCIVVTELLALRYPQFFTSFYLTLITALLANRYFEYVKTNYILCMGVLMMAIVVWQNSLVFHSLDKLTS